MNHIRLLKHVKKTWGMFYPSYCSSFSNKKMTYPFQKKQSNGNDRSLYFRNISNYSSMQTKDSDTNCENNDKMRRILEDEEFQNILKDFANDFGVDNETNELLDDIRKNIDDDYDKNKMSEENKNSKNDTSSSVLGGGLKHTYKEFSDADSTVIPSFEEHNEETETFYHIDHEFKPKIPSIELKSKLFQIYIK